MKRNLVLTVMALVMGMMLCFGLSACGSGSDSGSDADKSSETKKEESNAKMPYEGLDLEEYVTPGEYKGLKVDGYKIKISEQEIQEKVEEALKEHKTDTPMKKGDKLKKGDVANIDYEGKVDGKVFDGGASQGFDLELGSGTFIEGFEDGLIGHKVGETVEVKVHFPDDYQGEKVAGKDAVFTVKVNSAKRPKTPEYTEAFVKKNTEYDSKEAYESGLKKEIYQEKQEKAEQEQKTQLWSDVLDKTKMKKYPEEEMKNYEKVFSDQVDLMAQQYQVSREEVLKQLYGSDDEEKVKSMIEDSTKTLIKQEMLTEYIAKKENITYTDEEKDAQIKELEGQGYNDETVKQYTGRTMEQYAHIKLLYDKVQDFLLENAKIKKTK